MENKEIKEIKELLRMIFSQLIEKESKSEKEGELFKEIPLEVKTLEKSEEDEKELSSEDEKKKEEEKETAKRINEVVNAIKEMKDNLVDFLWFVYKMKLTDDELKELTNKILDLITSYVSDTTVERVRSFVGDELEVKKEK